MVHFCATCFSSFQLITRYGQRLTRSLSPAFFGSIMMMPSSRLYTASGLPLPHGMASHCWHMYPT